MVVASVYIVLIMLGLFVSQKGFKRYCYFCVIVTSGIYFFFNPLLVWHGYDLARYYDEFQYYSQLTFMDAIFSRKAYIGDSMFTDMVLNYPLFSVYMIVFSKIGIPKLLPFITGLICRFLELSSIFAVIDDRQIKMNRQQRFFWLAGFMMLHNLIEIGGLRNPIAISLCIWALVHELMLGNDKVLSIVCYVIACLFHSMAFAIVATRLVLYISDIISRRFFRLLLIFASVFFITLYFFPNMISDMASMLSLPTSALNALGKTTLYRRDLTGYPVWQLMVFGYTYLIVFSIALKVVKEHEDDTGYKNMFRFLVLYLLVVMLNFNITSLFGRSRVVFYPILLIFLPIYLAGNPFQLRSFRRMTMSMILTASVIGLMFSFDVYVTYLTMDSYIYL